MLKLIRTILAIVFWLGITLLFLDFTGTFLQYVGWMAKIQFLPSVLALNAVVILLLLFGTLLFGRIYCSIICPLGVLQDVFARIGRWKVFRKNKKAKFANKYTYSRPKTWLRIAVLVLFIVMMVAGFNAGAVLLAPYSSYGRMVASLLQPIYIDINNVLARLAEANDSYLFYEVEPRNNPVILLIISAVTALILFVLAFRNGRTYCNTICPVGTVLGGVAKFSFFKMRVVDEDKCIKCGLCEKNCKASCVKVEKDKPVSFDYSRCVACGNCQTVCSKRVIGYRFGAFGKKSADNISIDNSAEEKTADVSRRDFITVTGLAVAAATLEAQEKTTDGGLAVIEDKEVPVRKTPLTPPGSISARNFHQHCTACQLCIVNCPNNVLRPSQSLDRFMQPEMQYDKGYCHNRCTKCSKLCPTGAIRPITAEEKSEIQIGHAVWLKKNCIPIRDERTCGKCAKVCPVQAIQMVPVDKSLKKNPDTGEWMDADGNLLNEREILKIPVVNTEKCIGCGSCENLCPARPLSAIYVEGHEIHKKV